MGRIMWSLVWRLLPWVLVLILLMRPTWNSADGIWGIIAPWIPTSPAQVMPLNPIPSNPATQMLDEQTVVRQMNNISRLETQQAVIVSTFTLSNDEARTFWSWWSGELLMMRAVGTVTAGVDLANMSVNDIQVSADGRRVDIMLPTVRILSLTMDQTQTQPLNYEKGIGLLFDDSMQMSEQAYAKAEENILQTACATDMMERASQHAQAQLTQLIKAANPTVETVNIMVTSSDCVAVVP